MQRIVDMGDRSVRLQSTSEVAGEPFAEGTAEANEDKAYDLPCGGMIKNAED